MHRNRLNAADAERLQSWRARAETGSAPALILCVSPFVRFEDLERWSGVADLVLSEATAVDLLPRHVARLLEGRQSPTGRPDRPAFRIEVAGGNHELCMVVGEACAAAGFRVEQVGDVIMRENARPQSRTASPRERVLTIWDVPVLEPGWCERLQRYAQATGPVIALFGFADRTTVAQARANGAAACLELPYNVDDLLYAIDRTARSVPPASWPLPARVELPHLLPPRPAAAPGRVKLPPAPARRGQLTIGCLQFPRVCRVVRCQKGRLDPSLQLTTDK